VRTTGKSISPIVATTPGNRIVYVLLHRIALGIYAGLTMPGGRYPAFVASPVDSSLRYFFWSWSCGILHYQQINCCVFRLGVVCNIETAIRQIDGKNGAGYPRMKSG
jgi:hypothetical protein